LALGTSTWYAAQSYWTTDLQTKRWLLDDNSPLRWGHLFDYGDRVQGIVGCKQRDAEQCRRVVSASTWIICDLPTTSRAAKC